jgi:hypothetical protein
LIFSVADTAGYGNLEDQIKEYIALEEIRQEINAGDWETLEGKLPELKDDLRSIKDNLIQCSQNLQYTLCGRKPNRPRYANSRKRNALLMVQKRT